MNSDDIHFDLLVDLRSLIPTAFLVTTITQIVRHFSSTCRIKMKNMLKENDINTHNIIFFRVVSRAAGLDLKANIYMGNNKGIALHFH